MSADLTGHRLGHYLVMSVLGYGGMSTVYRAVDERLDRPVALKVISEDLSADGEFRQRFVEEARAASAIDHVNVVPLYDFGEAGNWLYIAMRLVDGTDLAKEAAGGPLPQRRVLDLLGQVGAALDMLHERGLVHLDVKPANVLITRNESIGREHVYLADFGLTRRGSSGHRTASGDFLGSPTYASPEHLRGDPVLPAADLYSLTCVLFTCLAGRAPFVGTVRDVVSGHLRGQVPSLSALTGLPSAIDRVIARGLAADASLRYSSSAELLGSTRRALSKFDEEPGAVAPAASMPGDAGAARRDAGLGVIGASSAEPTARILHGPDADAGDSESRARARAGRVQSDPFIGAPSTANRPYHGHGAPQPLLGWSVNDEPPGRRGPTDTSGRERSEPGFGAETDRRGAGATGGGPPPGADSQQPAGYPSGPAGEDAGARHRAPVGRSAWPWLAGGLALLIVVAVLVVILSTRGRDPVGPTSPITGGDATSSTGQIHTTAGQPSRSTASVVSPALSRSPGGTVSPPSSRGSRGGSGILPTMINPSKITEVSGLTVPTLAPSP